MDDPMSRGGTTLILRKDIETPKIKLSHTETAQLSIIQPRAAIRYMTEGQAQTELRNGLAVYSRVIQLEVSQTPQINENLSNIADARYHIISRLSSSNSNVDRTESLNYKKREQASSLFAIEDYFLRHYLQAQLFDVKFCQNILNQLANEDIEPGLEW